MVFCTEFLEGGGLESRCVGRVYGGDGAVWHHPHRTHDPRSGSLDHHPSTNSVQKTLCCTSTSTAPDDRRMYPKHVEPCGTIRTVHTTYAAALKTTTFQKLGAENHMLQLNIYCS